MNQSEKSRPTRRDILKGLGLGAAAAAALPVVAKPAAAKEAQPELTKSRYRENDHVKRYYALNRL